MEAILGDVLAKRVKRLDALIQTATSRIDYLHERLDLIDHDDDDEPLALVGDDAHEEDGTQDVSLWQHVDMFV